MKKSKEIFIEQYIYYIIEMQKAMSKDDYKTNNRYVLKLNKLNEKYEDEDYFIEALNELMDNDNLEIASNAAVDSLRNSSSIDKAIRTLEKISNRQDAGIVGFSAGIALKMWREKGMKTD